MTGITLEQARTIVTVALERARERRLAPMAVAVLDVRGALKAFAAEDGCSLLREDIAQGKAWGAIGLGFGTRELARRAQHAPSFIGALQAMSQGRLVPTAGGVLVRDGSGALLGAVGVSGDKPDADEDCATHGIRSV
ncbi:MAG: GlcG/HbpS family heme-binding protein, partial [Rubrivivax sp.]